MSRNNRWTISQLVQSPNTGLGVSSSTRTPTANPIAAPTDYADIMAEIHRLSPCGINAFPYLNPLTGETTCVKWGATAGSKPVNPQAPTVPTGTGPYAPAYSRGGRTITTELSELSGQRGNGMGQYASSAGVFAASVLAARQKQLDAARRLVSGEKPGELPLGPGYSTGVDVPAFEVKPECYKKEDCGGEPLICQSGKCVTRTQLMPSASKPCLMDTDCDGGGGAAAGCCVSGNCGACGGEGTNWGDYFRINYHNPISLPTFPTSPTSATQGSKLPPPPQPFPPPFPPSRPTFPPRKPGGPILELTETGTAGRVLSGLGHLVSKKHW